MASTSISLERSCEVYVLRADVKRGCVRILTEKRLHIGNKISFPLWNVEVQGVVTDISPEDKVGRYKIWANIPS